MSTSATLGTGYSTTAPTEQQLIYTKNGYRPTAGMPVILYFHSAGGNGAQPLLFPVSGSITNNPFGATMKALVEAGYMIFSADAGGTDTWGNDTVIARGAEMKTYAQAHGGASGKVVVMGASMGGAGAMAYTRANLSSVSCLLLFGPVADLQDIVTNNRGGLASRCNGAYAGGYSDGTYGATHSPVQFASQLTVPVQMWTSDQDNTVVSSTSTVFAAGVPNIDWHHGNWGDHGADTNYSNFSIPTMLNFLAANH